MIVERFNSMYLLSRWLNNIIVHTSEVVIGSKSKKSKTVALYLHMNDTMTPYVCSCACGISGNSQG